MLHVMARGQLVLGNASLHVSFRPCCPPADHQHVLHIQSGYTDPLMSSVEPAALLHYTYLPTSSRHTPLGAACSCHAAISKTLRCRVALVEACRHGFRTLPPCSQTLCRCPALCDNVVANASNLSAGSHTMTFCPHGHVTSSNMRLLEPTEAL